MWELEIQNIELEKGEGGLGFSILDYQVGNRFYKKCDYFAPMYLYFIRSCWIVSIVNLQHSKLYRQESNT